MDVSLSMLLEGGILSYDPGVMSMGIHTAEIKMKDIDNQDVAPLIWSFTIGKKTTEITNLFKYGGRVNSRISVEEVAGIPLNIAEVIGDISFDVQWAKLTTDLRLTTRESQYLQPQNRFGTQFTFGNFLDLDVGDFYPQFNPFMIDGKHVRGFGIDANLKWIRLQFIQGELNREVHQQDKINGG